MFFKKKDNTSQLEKLIADFRKMQSPIAQDQILELFPKVPLYYESWNIELGPDGFPYLNLSFRTENANQITLREIAAKG